MGAIHKLGCQAFFLNAAHSRASLGCSCHFSWALVSLSIYLLSLTIALLFRPATLEYRRQMNKPINTCIYHDTPKWSLLLNVRYIYDIDSNKSVFHQRKYSVYPKAWFTKYHQMPSKHHNYAISMTMHHSSKAQIHTNSFIPCTL